MEEMESKKSEADTAVDTAIETGIARRTFLKWASVGLGGILLGNITGRKVFPLPAEAETRKRLRISFDIFFSEHGKQQEAQELEKSIKTTDIFVPENYGWTEKEKKYFEAVSQGTMTVAEVVAKYGPRKEFSLGQLNALYNKRKTIEMIDLPDGNPLVQELEKSLDAVATINFGDDFNQALEKRKKVLLQYATIQKKREEYWMQELGKLSESISKRPYPALKNKKDIKILLALGAMHTGIFQKLREQRQEAARTFHRTPYRFSYINEVARRHLFHKEVSDDLIAKELLETLASNADSSWFFHSTEASFQRDILARFNTEEIKDLYNQMRSNQYMQYAVFRKRFRELAKKKGIELPRSHLDGEND